MEEGNVSNNPNNIKVGDLILREVIFSGVEPPRMVDLFPVESDHGGVIFRADPGEFYDVVDDRSWVITSNARRGMVCFCYFKLPPITSNVIGFEVKRINKNGTSVCVKPVFGRIATLLEHYNAPSGSIAR
ncbi:MAG: hypothetical protein WCW66_06570 [Patescibacteria group bacterium]|jgi:hypothetical protein